MTILKNMVNVNYIKLDLSTELKQEVYQIGKWIKENNTDDFQFENMEYDDIHMTICFIGQYLKSKKMNDSIIF